MKFSDLSYIFFCEFEKVKKGNRKIIYIETVTKWVGIGHVMKIIKIIKTPCIQKYRENQIKKDKKLLNIN